MNRDIPEPVRRARIQLMLAHPYLASAAAQLPFVKASGFDLPFPMATDGHYIYVNPEQVAGRSDDDLLFIVAHELLHCVLGHIDRRGDRARQLWNFAIDYATNALLVELGFTKPEDALYHTGYQGQAAEQIYDALIQLAGNKPIEQVPLPGLPNGPRLGAGAGPVLRQLRKMGSWPTSAAARRAQLDKHIEPTDLDGAETRRRQFPSLLERNRLRAALSAGIAKKLRGRLPGGMESEIRATESAKVPWQALLAGFISALRPSDYRLYPFNRKHLWRGIYLPAIGIPGPEHLVVAIDTSASMSDNEIAAILGEIDALRCAWECRLSVIQCDAALQRVQHYEHYEAPEFTRAGGRSGLRIKGRGGTDFRPVFAWLEDHSGPDTAPDALVYCTDGEGTFPERAPHIPVIWLLSSPVSVPFGSTINVGDAVIRR